MSTLKQSDPCSDILLDFIAGGVPGNRSGESGGNYDAVIGNAKSKRDLNVMTLAQIYALQGQLVASGMPSTAIGRYQFIRPTLQATAARLRLVSTSIFTEEVEDQLAVDLLNSACSYKVWRAGGVANDRFAHLLSTQWASLPDPQNGGKSHYDGDSAGNHASTTLSAVYAMLGQAQAALRGASVAASDATAIDAIRADVWHLQVSLAAGGYDSGEPDGWAGPRTQRALAAFVANHPGRLGGKPA